MRSERFSSAAAMALPVLLFFLCQCKEKVEYTDGNFFGGKVMILGHRGMGELYRMPGNTYEAIVPALAIGADGCEVDIQLTKDTVLVLFHDPYMDSRTNCSGRVYESVWADVCRCRYTAIENNIYVNSVDELLSRIPNLHSYYFSFDCTKVDEEALDKELYTLQYLRAIKRICDKYDMADNIFLEGSADLLLKARALGMTNKMFLFAGLDQSAITIASANGFFGISTTVDWMTVDADLAHNAGLYVMLWSPDNDAQNKDALQRKADIIQTDDPISILKLLNRYNYEYSIP
jgi:glycerophosphoryl diester phosphodiesterase